MIGLADVRKKINYWLYGPKAPVELPWEVREAFHRLNNSVAQLQAVTESMQRKQDREDKFS